MTDKTKLINLIECGEINLAIELSKGLGLDVIELLSDLIANLKFEEGYNFKKWCNFYIYDKDANPWFRYNYPTNTQLRETRAAFARGDSIFAKECLAHDSLYSLSKSMLNYYKLINEHDK